MKDYCCTFLLAASFFLALNVDAFAARNFTLFLDGAVVEQRESAKKGYLQISIPSTARPETLRILPGRGVEIQRVETAPLKPARIIEKELAQLTEREELLNDRLKALAVREEIFRSAAKSQSAKAPRRTKSNPEPLSTLKQGTDYAITQLEAVYHSRRKVEKELTQIAARRTILGRGELSGGTLARIWVSPASGSVTATWIQSDRKWLPSYQLRVDDSGKVSLSLMSQGVSLATGEAAELVISTLQSVDKPVKIRYAGEWGIVKKEEFKVLNMQPVIQPFSPFKMSFTNSSSLDLPPGDVSCFKAGVYMGKGILQGADAGKTMDVVCDNK